VTATPKHLQSKSSNGKKDPMDDIEGYLDSIKKIIEIDWRDVGAWKKAIEEHLAIWEQLSEEDDR